MKLLGPTFQWEQQDGKPTVAGIRRLRGVYAREWLGQYDLSIELKPVLLLTFYQLRDLMLDDEMRFHVPIRGLRHLEIAGFVIREVSTYGDDEG